MTEKEARAGAQRCANMTLQNHYAVTLHSGEWAIKEETFVQKEGFLPDNGQRIVFHPQPQTQETQR